MADVCVGIVVYQAMTCAGEDASVAVGSQGVGGTFDKRHLVEDAQFVVGDIVAGYASVQSYPYMR